MPDALADVTLTDTVVAALRLASTRRPARGVLDTQVVLLALRSVDLSGRWSQFLIDDQPISDRDAASADTWDGVPLSADCAEALARAHRITKAFHLEPMPAGVLALALVYDSRSGAARSFIGMTPAELVEQVQDEILGTTLEALPRVLGDQPTGDGQWPTSRSGDSPGWPERRLGGATTGHPHGDPRPGNAATTPHASTSFDPTATERGLASVTSRVPLGLLRLLTLAAVVGAAFGVLTSSAWTFRPRDDLAPPLHTPVIASAIPDDATAARLVGTELVRSEDGVPRLAGNRLYDSTLPIAYDIRTQAIKDAWAAHWMAANGGSEVVVQLARIRFKDPKTLFVDACSPAAASSANATTRSLGYVQRSEQAAEYCANTFDWQTQIYIGIITRDQHVMQSLPDRVAAIENHIRRALPQPNFPLLARVPTPYASAHLNRGLLVAVIGLPLLWVLPTKLFDRATWQRLWWRLSLRRFRSLPLPGLDIDPFVRERLWSAAALGCTQVCAAVWVLRLTRHWGLYATAIAVLTTILAISAGPRLLYLRRVGRSAVFAGRRRVLWLLGTLVAVLGIAFALLLAFAANTFSTIGAHSSAPDYAQQRFDLLLELLAVPAALVALAPTMLVRRVAMRALRTRQSADERPPILLLRSFADDGRRVRARSSHRRALTDRLSLRRWERLEEVIAASLAVHGPVYAVGQLGERLPPPLGAVRRQFSNDEWQQRIYELMSRASVICVTLGRSSALEWEIRRIEDGGFLPKTIFVLPPTSRKEHRKRLAVLAAVLNLRWADLDAELAGGWALAIRVSARAGTPQLIRARAQEDVGYDIALELCRAAIAGLELPTQTLPADLTLAPPTPEIYPTGRTPVFKPLLRRRWVWVILAVNASGLIGFFLTFMGGEKQDTSATIQLTNGYRAWAVAADPATSQAYAIVNGTSIAHLNFGDHSGTGVCRIDLADQLVARGGWAFTANAAAGTLQGIDLRAQRVVWTRRDLQGIRGVVTTDARLYFVLPSERRVVEVSRTTGKTVATRQLDAIPWVTAVDAAGLWVSQTDAHVVDLDLATLAERQQLATGPDPTQIAVGNGSVWAYSVIRHAVVAVTGPDRGAVIYTRSELPHIASNGSVLAIEGVEQISTLRQDDRLHRNRLWSRHADSIAVTATGDVIATSGDEIDFIRAAHA